MKLLSLVLGLVLTFGPSAGLASSKVSETNQSKSDSAIFMHYGMSPSMHAATAGRLLRTELDRILLNRAAKNAHSFDTGHIGPPPPPDDGDCTCTCTPDWFYCGVLGWPGCFAC